MSKHIDIDLPEVRMK